MKLSRRLALIMALVVIALEIGAYIYVTLFFRESLHVLIITICLCCLGVLLGIIVTRPKALAASVVIILPGIVALGSGFYLLSTFRYHERAYMILGIGVLCFLGGLAGITIRSVAATFFGMIVLGIVAFNTGLYFLIALSYHGRAYILLGTGALWILCSLTGIIVIRYKSHAVSESS
jgi:hypothetical protein